MTDGCACIQFNRRMDEWINEHEIVRQGTDEGHTGARPMLFAYRD